VLQQKKGKKVMAAILCHLPCCNKKKTTARNKRARRLKGGSLPSSSHFNSTPTPTPIVPGL